MHVVNNSVVQQPQVPPDWMGMERTWIYVCVCVCVCTREWVFVWVLSTLNIKMESRRTHTHTHSALIRPEYETVQLT